MTRVEQSRSLRVLRSFAGLADRIIQGFVPVAKLATLILLITTIFDLVTRRFFVLGSTRLQELEWHMHVVIFTLCLGYSYVKNRHVRIDLFYSGFSPRVKHRIEILGILILALPYLGLLIYFGSQFFWQSYLIDEPSKAALGIPHRWIIKFFLPLGLGLLVLAALSALARSILGLLDPQPTEEQKP